MNNTSNPEILSELEDRQTFAGASFKYPDETETIITVILLSLVILMTIVGNAFVISAFIMNRNLRINPNSYIVSLATADCLVAVLSVPLWIYYLLTQNYSNKILFVFYSQFDIFSGIASIVHLTLVSLERMYAILRPLQHRMSMVTKGPVLASIIVAWFIAVTTSSLNFLGWIDFGVFITVSFFVFPVVIIISAYVVIYIKARKYIREHGAISIKKEVRHTVTIAIVVGCFILCWCPFFVIILLVKYCRLCDFTDMRIIIFVKFLHYANSAFNPIIYGLRHNEFQLTFWRLLMLMCCYPTDQSTQENERSFARRGVQFPFIDDQVLLR